MTSLQEPARGSKSAKFIESNPLDPMLKPFEGLNEEQQDVQRQVAQNVNDRLEKAMQELQEKHRRGTNERDDPDRAPTGQAYRQLQQQNRLASLQQQQQQQQDEEESRRRLAEETQQLRRYAAEQIRAGGDDNLNDGADNDSDTDYDDLLDNGDDDPVLVALRQRRLQELQAAQRKQLENLAKGHGQYRIITQDEFLPECIAGSSEYVVVHFFLPEFERCQILEHHLKIVAALHTECKFLGIQATKAPFFVTKLQVRTLPTLLVFQKGQVVDRLTGFEGLMTTDNNKEGSLDDSKNHDELETSRLQEWLGKTQAIDYKPPPADLQEEMRRLGLHGSVYRGGVEQYNSEN